LVGEPDVADDEDVLEEVRDDDANPNVVISTKPNISPAERLKRKTRLTTICLLIIIQLYL